jgi:hypothetical protein
MLFENTGQLRIGRKPSLTPSRQTAIDAGKLGRRCLIFASSKAGVDFKRNLRELGLGVLGPFLRARSRTSLRILAVMTGIPKRVGIDGAP